MGKAGTITAAVIASLVIFSAIVILVSPIFEIRKLVITGNVSVTEELIEQTAGPLKGTNIFFITKSGVRKKLLSDPYISAAETGKTYPGTLTLEITERIPRGYVEYKNTEYYLLIDEDGIILETSLNITRNLPVITGVKIKNFSLGKALETHNMKSFENIITFSRLLKIYEIDELLVKHEIRASGLRLDFTDENDIHLYINNIDCIFGTMDEAELKIGRIREVIDSLYGGIIPTDERGEIDFSNTSANPVFKRIK